MKIKLLLIIALGAFGSYAQTISTEAPSASASGTTVPKNTLQIESSLGVSHDGYLTSFTLPYSLFRLGISDRWELRLNNSFNIQKLNATFFNSQTTFHEFGALQVGTKFQFIKNPESKTKLAAIATLTIPKHDDNLRAGQLNLCFSQQLGDSHTVGANLGWNPSRFVGSGVDPDITNDFNFSVIYGYSITSKLSVFGELFGLSYENLNKLKLRSLSMDFGVMYLIRDNIQIDYAFGRGLTDNFDFHTVGFNILLNSKK